MTAALTLDDLARDPFADVLGDARGARVPLHLERDPAARLRALAQAEGLEGALRALGPHRRRALASATLADTLTDLALDEVYAHKRPELAAWLHAVAVRPHWALHFVLSGDTVHFFEHGHLFLHDSDGYALKPDTQPASRAPTGFVDLGGDSISTQIV